jgi:hypothetical protein
MYSAASFGEGVDPSPGGLASPKEDPPPNPAMSNRLIFVPIDVQPPGAAASAEASASAKKSNLEYLELL